MIKLTHLNKIYWKEDKITKGDLIEYYAEMAPYILPYLKDRPLVMHRYPEGYGGEMFYQKEAGDKVPKFVKTVTVQHEAKTVNYIVVQNANTLLYVANLGSIEMHPWNSTIKKLNKPDYVVLDLDPVTISFNRVIEVANVIHDVCEELKLPNFCKTTGGDGLHIYIPLHAKYDYDEVKSFAFLLANLIHEKLPSITSLERMPKKRQKKVYLDCLQNLKGQTLAAPYSVRGRPHATVSTPLLWKEVKPGLDPTDFTIKTVPKRVKQKGDLFKKILGKGIDLKSCLKKIEKII